MRHWSAEEVDYIKQIYRTGKPGETHRKFCERFHGRSFEAYKAKACELGIRGVDLVDDAYKKPKFFGVRKDCVFYREAMRRNPDFEGSCKLIINEGYSGIDNCGDCTFYQTVEQAKASSENGMRICEKRHPYMTREEVYDHCHAEIAKRLIAGKKKDMERYPEAYKNGKNSNHNR